MPQPTTPLLAINLQHVYFAYENMAGKQVILEDINFKLKPGEKVALLGPNGSGKTTLLKILLGLLKPTAGEVYILGQKLYDLNLGSKKPNSARTNFIGYVPQHPAFEKDFPIKVLDVVLMGLLGLHGIFHKPTPREIAFAQDLLAQLHIADLAKRQISQLSLGQLQRVLIARALALQPKILLLDEPTASLDSKIGQNFWEILSNLDKEITTIIVSHDISAVSKHIEAIACLNKTLYYEPTKKLKSGVLNAMYGHPIDLLIHEHSNVDEHLAAELAKTSK